MSQQLQEYLRYDLYTDSSSRVLPFERTMHQCSGNEILVRTQTDILVPIKFSLALLAEFPLMMKLESH